MWLTHISISVWPYHSTNLIVLIKVDCSHICSNIRKHRYTIQLKFLNDVGTLPKIAHENQITNDALYLSIRILDFLVYHQIFKYYSFEYIRISPCTFLLDSYVVEICSSLFVHIRIYSCHISDHSSRVLTNSYTIPTYFVVLSCCQWRSRL